MIRLPPSTPCFPYTTLFRSDPVLFMPCDDPVCCEHSAKVQQFAISLEGVLVERRPQHATPVAQRGKGHQPAPCRSDASPRSEEHTSELQSHQYLVCRLLLEK